MTAEGVERSVKADQFTIHGRRDDRGYVSLSDLGAGARVDLQGADGKKVSLPTASFPDQHRLFVSRRGAVSLVRFKEPKAAPETGTGGSKNRGPHHRSRWDTVLEQVVRLQFVASSP